LDNLIVTLAIDSVASRLWRNSCKLWIASLLRHGWSGRIHAGRNFERFMFMTGRPQLDEVVIPDLFHVPAEREDARLLARARLLEIVRGMEDAGHYQWVVLSDADCVSLRNIDHLFCGGSDLLVSGPVDAPDPGFFAVRGERLGSLVAELDQSGGLDGRTLAQVCGSPDWSVRSFERGEVLRPGDPQVALSDIHDAAVLHLSGLGADRKGPLAFALHMMAVYGDKDGLFFDILES
jgi:hypothetical protein